jgi:[ribosomal protein S5]-alanine N-acetyltransferase
MLRSGEDQCTLGGQRCDLTMAPIPPRAISTDRLLLRPTTVADADRAFQIQSDWEVTRMLRLVPFPPDIGEIRQWFAGHAGEWETGRAVRFAMVRDGRMIGLVDIDTIAERMGTLGYWLDRAAWGHGYATEAAQAVIRLAADELHLVQLKAGHAEDNPASGRILTKLGFRFLDTVQRFSRPRNATIWQRRYRRTLRDEPRARLAEQ